MLDSLGIERLMLDLLLFEENEQASSFDIDDYMAELDEFEDESCSRSDAQDGSKAY